VVVKQGREKGRAVAFPLCGVSRKDLTTDHSKKNQGRKGSTFPKNQETASGEKGAER